MHTITTVAEMLSWSARQRSEGRRVGLVPTMGALHEGHLSLVRHALERSDVVVVSIFVNPTQFGPSEDFSRYPRELEDDLKKCEAAGAAVAFAPAAAEIYPKRVSTYITEEFVAKPLEGISRPNHFRGVTTIVAKLFNLVRPEVAVFGQKDAQQVAVIRKMAADLHFPVEIVTVATLRDADGLALSSRNRFLTPVQRLDALAIHQALRRAQEMVAQGERRADRLVAEATHLLGQRRRLRVIYAAVVDRDTMEAVREVATGQTLMAIASWVDEVRLIDNEIL
jgi:pantoate--beta-alanine ligase